MKARGFTGAYGLVVTDQVHIGQWGVFVTTPQSSAAQATVNVQTTVTNQSAAASGIFVMVSLLDSTGRIAGSAETHGQTLEAGKSAQIEQDIVVKNPQLWSLENPSLYQAVVTVKAGINGPVSYTIASTLDSETNSFGIRDAK